MGRRMAKWGVTVEMSRPLTAERVKAAAPDVVVVATGVVPVGLGVPGAELPHVAGAWDVLAERVPDVGRSVVIIGGSATGCETAHFVAGMDAPDPRVVSFLLYHGAEDTESAGQLLHGVQRNITVVEMVDRVADNVGRTARWPLLKSLRLAGVTLRTGTRLVEITPDAVIVETDSGRRESLPADTVILAVGVRPENRLASDLAGSGIRVITLGDARQPRRLQDAVREGFEAALDL